MYRIAVNVAISFYRQQARYRQSVSIVDNTVLFAVPDTAVRQPDENLERLHELIYGLDELNRALMLLYLDDYPQATIADSRMAIAARANQPIGEVKVISWSSCSGEESRSSAT